MAWTALRTATTSGSVTLPKSFLQIQTPTQAWPWAKRTTGWRPAGLEGGSKEEGRVKAGGKPLIRDATGAAYLLAFALKRSGRLSIGESESGDGRPDGSSEEVCAARILGLVAVHRAVVARSLKKASSVLHHASDRRIIGRDESREDLGHVAHTAPFVASKKIDAALLHDGRNAVRLDSELELADFRFVEACQALDVEGGGDVAKRERGLACDTVDGQTFSRMMGGAERT